MESLDGIRERMKASIDIDYYDRCYALQIWMAGYYDQCIKFGGLEALRNQGEQSSQYELPDYRTLSPEFEDTGVQNHGLVNSRINIQGVVNARPSLNVKSDDPTHRAVLSNYFLDSWTDGDWSTSFLAAGMEVEACGLGPCVCEPTADDGVTWTHSPIMDTLFDRAYRMPAQWRWMAHRRRLPLDDATEYFGEFVERKSGESKEDAMRGYAKARLLPLGSSTSKAGTAGTIDYDTNIQDDVIHCWYYSDKGHQVCFVGSVGETQDKPGLVLAWDGKQYVKSDKALKNHYGVVPGAFWLDSWCPGIDRPTAKSETTIRLASMLNELEKTMVWAIRTSRPKAVLDASNVEGDLAEQLKQAVTSGRKMDWLDLDDLIITNGGNINEILQRIEPIKLPEIWVTMRAMLKQEMNPATGVMDMQRGQALTGEKTRYEVEQLVDNSGVQARHLRDQYGNRFLVQVAKITFAVATVADTKPRILQLDDGPLPINGKGFPLENFTAENPPCTIDPASLLNKTEEDLKNEAIAEFRGWLEKALADGVANPYRVYTYLARKFGHRDPSVILNTPDEMKQQQEAKKDAAAAGAHAQMKELINMQIEKLPLDIQQQIFVDILGLKPSQMLGLGTPNPQAEQEGDERIEHIKQAGALQRENVKQVHTTQRELAKVKMQPKPEPAAKSA